MWHTDEDGDTDWGVCGVYSSLDKARYEMKVRAEEKQGILADEEDCSLEDICISISSRAAYVNNDCSNYYSWGIEEHYINYKRPPVTTESLPN